MTKRTCYTCGTVYEGGFSMFTCNVCQQTKAITAAMKAQADAIRPPKYQTPVDMFPPQTYYGGYSAPVYHEPVEYIPPEPPTAEEVRKAKEIRFINLILSTLLILFPFVAPVILWMLTSGWVTFFTFIAVPFAFIRLGQMHHTWKLMNATYLYHIR